MRLIKGAATGLVALIAMGGLGACTGDAPRPSPTPTLSSSPTPTPTPTTPPEAVPPERPAAMDEISVAGAEATAAYFLELYPYVYATGDLAVWRALSDPECVFCNSVIENVESQTAAGETSKGSAIEIVAIFGSQITPERFGVNASIMEGPFQTLDASGAVISEETEDRAYDAVFALRGSASGWTVLQLDVNEVQ